MLCRLLEKKNNFGKDIKNISFQPSLPKRKINKNYKKQKGKILMLNY